MKKLILIMVLMVSSLWAFEVDDVIIEPKLGVAGYYSIADSNYEWISLDFIGLDTYYKFTENFEFGAGIMISFLEFKDENKELFNIRRAPVYMTGKYYFFNEKKVKPYIKGALGYQVILQSPQEGFNNGLYSAIGFGLDIKKFVVELNIAKDINTGDNESIDESVATQLVFAYRI